MMIAQNSGSKILCLKSIAGLFGGLVFYILFEYMRHYFPTLIFSIVYSRL